MATPPNSGRRSVSSLPVYLDSQITEAIRGLVTQARQVQRLNPIIDGIVFNNTDTFFSIFSRRMSLIKSRSQDFDHCEITVYDKTLLELTFDGTKLNDPAAITFFCQEFLLGSPADWNELREIVETSEAAMAAMTPAPVYSPPSTQRALGPDSGERVSPHENNREATINIHGHNSALLTTLVARIDASAVRLWAVYEKAKEDFLAISDSNSFETQKSAKFLRDTAENILGYVREKSADQRLIDELETTCSTAKHTAMTLHGGKKRKFDDAESTRNISQSTYMMNRREPARERRAFGQVIRRPQYNKENHPRDVFDGHVRALAYQLPARDTSSERGRKRFAASDTPLSDTTQTQQPKKKKKKQPGRGHSGIPFGYTRPVDSYQPGY